MSRFSQFFTASIRNRIFFAFLTVTLFVLMMVVTSYLQLSQVKPFSDLIIDNSSGLVYLQKLAAATSALDADLERYLIIRGAEYQENVQKDLQNMTDTLKSLQETPPSSITADLGVLAETITRLQAGVQKVVAAQLSGASSGDINRSIVTVYKDIDEIKQQQDNLSIKTLAELEAAAETQGRLANDVLVQSLFLGILVSVIAIVTTLTTDRRLRAISTLTNVTAAIAEGDITQLAPVAGNDEISKLAVSFNTMTAQLRDLIGSLEQRVAARTQALATSSEVSRRLSTILDSRQLILEVVEQAQSALGYYHVHIYLVDEANGDLVMAGGTGAIGQTMLAQGHKIARGRGLVGRAAENNQVVFVPDVSSDSEWLPNALLPDTQAEAAVPIAIGSQVLGVLDVQDNKAGGLDLEDITLLRSLANQVAIGLRNARSYAEIQRRAEREALIASIGQKIQNATTIEGALQVTVRELGRALDTQTSVRLVQSDKK